MIRVNSGANLTLEDTSEDKTGTITGGHAGDGSRYGGGVLASSNAVFTMKGGTISNCTAWGGGGVYSCGSFTMKGGTITDCTAINGGGVFNSGSFTMKGGTITDCTATNGGGVYNYSLFAMNGGTITGCTATQYGGGVYNHPFSELINTSTTGATICYGTLYNDNGTIDGNLVEFKIDDGIYAWELVPTNGKAVEPTAPTKTGFIILEGWYEKDDAGAFKANAFDFDTTITAGTTLYAKLTPITYTITYNLNGGVVPFLGNPTEYTVENNITLSVPIREGYQFIGWSGTGLSGNTNITVTIHQGTTGNREYTAHWKHVDHVGGTATCQEEAVCTTCQDPYGEKNPDNHVGDFVWQSNAENHWKYYATCKHTTTPEPHKYDANGKCICEAIQYIVTFDPNGGTVDTTTATTDADGKLTSIPTPTRKDYNFLGWFTESGEMITNETVFTEHTTVYAHWQILSSSLLPTWQQWELIDKIVAANKKKDEPVETEPEVTEPVETEPEETEPVEEPWENPFSDVTESDAFYDAIKFVYENGYMNGMTENTFAPGEGLTRGMLVTVLYRAAGSPVMDEANPFTDVAEDAWYYNAVVWAKSIGLVNGITETEFAPEDELTREQLVTIFYRYATFLGYDLSIGEDTNILSCEDFADIAEYAIPAMQWACGMNLIDNANGNILPKDNATRALVAMVLFGFYTK